MKVALVHDWLTGYRGGEKCLEVLCRHFPEATLYTLLHRPGSTTGTIERMDIRTSFLQRIPGSLRHYRYLLPLMPRAIESLKIAEDVDLVVSISHAVAKGVRVPASARHVCYCLTPMRYAWYLRDQYFQLPNRCRHWSPRRLRDRMLDRIAAWDLESNRGVDEFLACSGTVQQRIATCYARPAEVVYPPVDTTFYCPAQVAREDFYLCVSALTPYKRIELAIQACNRLKRNLVVIGEGPLMKSLERLAGPTVHLAGWCSDETIRDHYRRCRALIFPALEDFGIVPVEAQACGAPVVAFGEGGASETVIEASSRSPGTGVFFSEQTVESLCQALRTFEREAARCSEQTARRNALRFSQVRFEHKLLARLYQAAPRDRAARHSLSLKAA